LIIIAVYAAQLDPENCEADVKRIADAAERLPEFVTKRESILSFINKFVNSMQAFDPQKAVQIAAGKLTPEQRKTAFELAAKVMLTDKVLNAEKKTILKSLENELSISAEFAQKTIAGLIG
jgi:hypothetical protein